MSDDDVELPADLFHEDEVPTPPPVVVQYKRSNGAHITLRLVHHSPLWGHLLWSASKILAHYLEQRPAVYQGKYVLELGAAAGLPSLVCALGGAGKVVVTDYPDPDLLQNLQHNVDHAGVSNASVRGFIWGRDVTEITHDVLDNTFDLIILSDLIFNHQAHPDLLQTCQKCLSLRPGSQVLVFFTHHRPFLAHKDDNFFTLARETGFMVDRVVEDKSYENVMFEEDPGSRDVRATVHGYRMTFQPTNSS